MALTKPVRTSRHELDYGILGPSFIDALKHWKLQNISFLDLPGELRNHIYNLLISDTSEHYTEVMDLDPRSSAVLPIVALIFTCRELQREVLPLYFRAINLRLCYNDPPWPAQCVDSHVSKVMNTYVQMDPYIVDHLRSLRLESSIVGCNIKVTDPRNVHIELFASGCRIPSTAMTQMSIEIRDRILDSLSNSPTGLLGIRHFQIAFRTILQIDEWYEWIEQEDEREQRKMQEAPWRDHGWWTYIAFYQDYLVEQAIQEVMPRLILATTSLQDGAEMYD